MVMNQKIGRAVLLLGMWAAMGWSLEEEFF